MEVGWTVQERSAVRRGKVVFHSGGPCRCFDTGIATSTVDVERRRLPHVDGLCAQTLSNHPGGH